MGRGLTERGCCRWNKRESRVHAGRGWKSGTCRRTKGWKGQGCCGQRAVSVARRLSPRPVDRAPLHRKSYLALHTMRSSADCVDPTARDSRRTPSMWSRPVRIRLVSPISAICFSSIENISFEWEKEQWSIQVGILACRGWVTLGCPQPPVLDSLGFSRLNNLYRVVHEVRSLRSFFFGSSEADDICN